MKRSLLLAWGQMRPDSSKNCHTSLALNFPRFLIFVLRYKFSDHNTALCKSRLFGWQEHKDWQCGSVLTVFVRHFYLLPHLKKLSIGKFKKGLPISPDFKGGHKREVSLSLPYTYTITSFLSRDHKLHRRGILVSPPLFSFWLLLSNRPLDRRLGFSQCF